jgi:hypothetical protein
VAILHPCGGMSCLPSTCPLSYLVCLTLLPVMALVGNRRYSFLPSLLQYRVLNAWYIGPSDYYWLGGTYNIDRRSRWTWAACPYCSLFSDPGASAWPTSPELDAARLRGFWWTGSGVTVDASGRSGGWFWGASDTIFVDGQNLFVQVRTCASTGKNSVATVNASAL